MEITAELLTTEQLLDACARQGAHVSTTQLGRWVRAGLIPASLRKRHGRGRGQGTEWLWEAECQVRVMIIHQTLSTGDPSLMRAAHALAAAGYPPDAHCLRQIMLDGLIAFERLLAKRQTYLTDERPADDKRRRLKRNMRRWTPDMPDELFQRFHRYVSATFGVISLEELDAQPFFHHMQGIISIPAMRQRLQMVEDDWLLAKYEEASKGLPLMAALGIAMVNMLLPAFAEWARHHNKPQEPFLFGIDAEKLLAGMRQEGGRIVVDRENPVGEVRLIFMLMLAIFPVEEEKVLAEWTKVLSELFVGLTRYLNIPTSHPTMVKLLEGPMEGASGHAQ